MSINNSNGRPVYQHRRTQSSGLNTEGQPTTEQIEEGEIAINLTTRKIYTRRKQVIRGADSDFLEGPTVQKAGAIAYTGSDSDLRLPGFMPYGQQIKNGVKLKIIQRRLLDSDEAGKNITFQISQKYFLDYANALDYPRNSGSQWTGLANSTRSDLASNYDITYDGRHVPDSDEFGVTGDTTVNQTSTKSASSRLSTLLHDSDGTAAVGAASVNAVGGNSFGGGVVEISFNMDSDFTTAQVAERINNAIAASTTLDTLDSKIICEIDSDNPEIIYIHGGDKVIDFIPSEKFVTYIDYGVTPLYKFYSKDLVVDNGGVIEGLLFQRSSVTDSYPKRIEVTFRVPSEISRRVAVSGYTLPTTTKGFQDQNESPLFNRPSVVLRDTVGNIGSIDSDNVFDNEFGFRSADFGASNEVVSLNAIATVGPNAPEFDVGSGNLWVEDRSNKTPRYDAVDSETHVIEVNIYGRNGVADGPIPATVGDFEIDYGPLQSMADYNDSDTKLLIEGGDTAESIAFKIYRLLSGITRSGKDQIEADSDATGILINDVILSNDTPLQGPGTRSIGAETGVTSQTGGYNIVKASFDSEHDSELFGYDIYIQDLLDTGDSDGVGEVQRHKITVEAVKKSHKNKGDSDSEFTGMIIAISDNQQETNRVKAGKQAAELYYLDATLIDDVTAQTIALTYDDDDARQAVNVVVYDFKPDVVNRDSDGAKRFAEWRKVTAPSILSPQAADFQVGGQTFSASATLRILDVNGATIFSGSVLL